MVILALCGGLLLAVSLALWATQVARHHALQIAALEHLRANLDAQRAHLKRMLEDLHVLQTVLCEHHVLDDGELAQSRVRLIENPRRQAEERSAILHHLGVAPQHLVVDEGDGKIH